MGTFSIGQTVHHRKFDYRGVIIGVDETFIGSDEWYDAVARSRPPKDMPWYHVLVHGASHRTYVAERHLEPDVSREPIRHPEVDDFFDQFRGGAYINSLWN
ncbi:MAG: heat shock protein HspQ [Dehalococcoidia bacterium]